LITSTKILLTPRFKITHIVHVTANQGQNMFRSGLKKCTD
jgi:hypothetical protein